MEEENIKTIGLILIVCPILSFIDGWIKQLFNAGTINYVLTITGAVCMVVGYLIFKKSKEK